MQPPATDNPQAARFISALGQTMARMRGIMSLRFARALTWGALRSAGRWGLLCWGVCCGMVACQTGADGSGRSVDDCSLSCWRIANANCGDIGEECFDRCVKTDPTPAECATEQQQYTDCFWQTDFYTCDPDLGTLPTTCDDQRNAVRACLGLGDASSDASVSDAASDASPNSSLLDATGDQ